MKLRHKILFILLAFSLVATVVMDLVRASILRAGLQSLAGERLQMESALIAGELGPALFSPGADLHALVRKIGSQLGARVSLLDRTGVLLADSEMPAAEMPSDRSERDRPEVRDALDRGMGSSTRFDRATGRSVSYFARLVHGTDGQILCLRLAVRAGTLEEGGGSLRVVANVMVISAFLIMTALAYHLARGALRPLEVMARAADEAASGGSTRSLAGMGGGPDLTALGSSIDRMRRALVARISDLGQEQKLRDTVLSGMREGLLVVDVNRKVILANSAIRSSMALGSGGLSGRTLAEVVRDPDVGSAFARTLADREEHRCQVEIAFPAERVFELLVEPLDAEDGRPLGAIGLFVDVTRLQALERIRSTFISDLSHEIRTPLASAGAALETLQDLNDMTEEERARFFAILKRNVERIRALLEDLTDLSRIETGSITLEPEPIELSEVVREVLASLSGMAARSAISLTCDIPADLRIRADHRRLDQILMNVVENAIKFNKRSGQVHVRAQAENGEVRIRVEDTGEGIPEAEREKIFLRFYRVDRSRSREAGGRGLGLAIVKHLMRLHEGSVHVEERPGGGTIMVLTFPRKLNGILVPRGPRRDA